MHLPIWALICAIIGVTLLAVAFLYACSLAYRHSEYNKRLLIEVLEGNEANQKLAKALTAYRKKYGTISN